MNLHPDPDDQGGRSEMPARRTPWFHLVWTGAMWIIATTCIAFMDERWVRTWGFVTSVALIVGVLGWLYAVQRLADIQRDLIDAYEDEAEIAERTIAALNQEAYQQRCVANSYRRAFVYAKKVGEGMEPLHDRSNPGPRPVESQRLVMMTCPTGHRWVHLDGFSKKTCDTCNQPPSHRELYGHVLSPHEIERVCDLLEQVGPINLSVHDPTHEHDPPGRDVTLCETCRRSTTLPSADELAGDDPS